ncbi:MAG TPA: U32 family peptidase [Methanothermobacter sp.]|jgi:putative protease|uniref:Peptidase U32 n=1 Tax=Methanothermobacter tenebrarum TaxID=680118 RepID=A0ABN6PF10_9EURY|nr:U32 family peptidase [Methanothermobacter tenebrarum]MDI6881720.1 U32 family peptidase [Methanothermobacter sp.]MDX9692530.1 U32 family peptidase [Methanothermobacter sp.]BDH79308.1 peptidase U32 [Methanothermobacter tenebrarum]HHW16168.1 U32 family peptidase [Methanothermobacter sp.]HOQ20260.1 U32 family peptidase [Methanothermobacter sp.]
MVELLAPARDFPSISAALKNGADAVYIGMEGCNLRANVSNFSLEDIKEATRMIHDNNKRVYVCTNTILKDKDLKELESKLPSLHSFEVDALIVSDLGAIDLAVDNGLNVHVSVQANISNTRSLDVLKKMGAERVILSRELSLDDIKEIVRKSPLEVEVFVHGALCMAISGRCLLSYHLYGKSANHGECLQPCRKAWKLISEDGETLILEAGQGNIQSYILSPRDLCMIEHIPSLIDAGIHALKIEGRARPADYVATVTRVYREAIDSHLNGSWEFKRKWIRELEKVFNRGFDEGFYFNNPKQGPPQNRAKYIKKDIGQVLNYYRKAGAAEIRLWDKLKIGDDIIIQGKTTGSITEKVKSLQINGKNVKKAEKCRVGVKVTDRVRPGDLVYKIMEKGNNG